MMCMVRVGGHMHICGEQRTAGKLVLSLLGLCSKPLYPVTRPPTDLNFLLTFLGPRLALTRRLTPKLIAGRMKW